MSFLFFLFTNMYIPMSLFFLYSFFYSIFSFKGLSKKIETLLYKLYNRYFCSLWTYIKFIFASKTHYNKHCRCPKPLVVFMHIFSYKKNAKKSVKTYTVISKEVFYRIWYFVFCFTVSCMSSWIYRQEILYLYVHPLYKHTQNIIFTSISEAFSTTLHACISISAACSFPFFVYLLLCFFLPSLFPKEKTSIYILCFLNMFCYIFAFFFCTCFIIPELCSWFLKYGTSTDFLYLCLQAKVSTYVCWSEKIYIYVICILQLPVAIHMFSLKRKTFSFEIFNNRKYTCICLLIFCAIISPPDLYSQGVLFCFFMVICEYVLWLCFLQESIKKRKKV